MNLTSSLELRASSCVAATIIADFCNGRQTASRTEENGHGPNGCAEASTLSNGQNSFDLVKCVDELIASADLADLQTNRGFLTLPRFCVEVLHVSKEERDAVQPRPLCELVLDWAHKAWLDDKSVNIDDTFLQKPTLLIMSKDNSLQDCSTVEEGSPNDSDLIKDYKKSNQHLEKPKTRPRLGRRGGPLTVKPAKPREMLYTRHINHEDASRSGSESSEQYRWKVIAAHRLDSKTIMAIISLDAKLITLSLVQRINVPSSSSPTMIRSSSEGSLTSGLGYNLCCSFKK